MVFDIQVKKTGIYLFQAFDERLPLTLRNITIETVIILRQTIINHETLDL